MRRVSWWLGLAALAVLLGCSSCWCGTCFAGEDLKADGRPGPGEPRAAQLLCPVTGAKRADAKTPVNVEFEGFRFWVADRDAAEKAKLDPAAAFKALEKNGDAAEPVSRACPVMGHKVNPKLFVQREGRRIYMCCMGCRKRIENNWPAMRVKLAQQAKDGDPEDLKGM